MTIRGTIPAAVRLFCAMFIVFHALPLWSAAPVIAIDDYTATLDFTGRQAVLINRGDDPAFARPEYDDRDWKAIALPSSWNSVYPDAPSVCWYRVRVRFPAGLPDYSLGVELGIISDVDELFFNGQRVGGTGKFPPGRVSAYDRKRIYELPTTHIRPGTENVLALRVAGLFPYENGPYRGNFRIGPYQELQRRFIAREFFDMLFVMVYLAVAVYFGIIFITRSIDREYLFFALFTLSTAVYLFLRTQAKYFLTENFLLLKRVEYLMLFIILFFLMEYITYFFSGKHGPLHYLYWLVTAATTATVVVFNDVFVWNRVLLWVVEPGWLVPLGYYLYMSARAYRSDPDAKYVLAALPFLWIVFINDVLVDRGLLDSVRIANYGFMVIIVATAVVMRNRFLRLYSAVAEFQNRRRGVSSISDDNRGKMERAIAYLKENYRSDISRENLAESLGLNGDYFGKLFKQYTGTRIGDFVNELRVRDACDLLVAGRESVTDIAFAVGFESLSTFYRVFQGIIGDTPTGWLEKRKGGR